THQIYEKRGVNNGETVTETNKSEAVVCSSLQSGVAAGMSGNAHQWRCLKEFRLPVMLRWRSSDQ
ncbi:hypothetical protein A2U01_0055076, partial [Trifolium medium]|nr:hypothetical protein [Trifolium medium]